eukprot:7389725-Prymnesium_polylepis.1
MEGVRRRHACGYGARPCRGARRCCLRIGDAALWGRCAMEYWGSWAVRKLGAKRLRIRLPTVNSKLCALPSQRGIGQDFPGGLVSRCISPGWSLPIDRGRCTVGPADELAIARCALDAWDGQTRTDAQETV